MPVIDQLPLFQTGQTHLNSLETGRFFLTQSLNKNLALIFTDFLHTFSKNLVKLFEITQCDAVVRKKSKCVCPAISN